jgi:type II secretory pathway component PulC
MYEELLREAEREGVEVISWSLKGNTKGAYYNGVIALGKNITTTAEKTCVLAEELGHHYTTAGNILDQKVISNRKQEIKAKRWAVKRLVSLNNIIKAYEAGCRNQYEMAEYIGVTEDFLKDAFATYNAMYGKCKKRGNYIIYFDPPGVYKNL